MNDVHIYQKVIIINAQGNILALRRSATDPHKPLTWDLPGGEIDEGEELETAVRREVREETRLEIKNVELKNANGAYNTKGQYWLGLIYIAEALHYDIILSYEHDQCEWISKEEFLNRESSMLIHATLKKL